MRKKLLALVGLMLFYFNYLEAQDISKLDKRLLEVFDEEYLKQLQETSPEILKYFEIELNDSYSIEVMPDSKNVNELPNIFDYISIPKNPVIKDKTIPKTLEYVKSNDFNILRFSLKREKKGNSNYRIGNTKSILVLISSEELLEKKKNNK